MIWYTRDDIKKWPIEGDYFSNQKSFVHKNATVGAGATIGEGATIDERATIGERAKVGEGATAILADLGLEQQRQYGRCAYINKDGVPIINAGCHHFTLAEARKHWGSSKYPDRKRGDEYLALVDYVEALCKIQGIKG